MHPLDALSVAKSSIEKGKNHPVEEVIEALQFCLKATTQTQLAEQLGITPPYLSDLLHRKRDPGERVLKALGLRKVVYYVRD